MPSDLSLLQQLAVTTAKKSDLPNPSAVVESLLDAEKKARKTRRQDTFDDLIGCWQLCFITGTKKTREKAGIVLGAGRYIPKWIGIEIKYDRDSQSDLNHGRVQNSVNLGFLALSLTGPVKFVAAKNILAFDFTNIAIAIFGLELYNGYLLGGEVKESEFYQQPISKQAFFSYFLIEPEIIAARGKGGGLALWNKRH